jgi:F0F1-type ATP synthase membrane subunit b/b'
VREVTQHNLGCCEAAAQKLDAWADGLKCGLENELKECSRETQTVRRTAQTVTTLEEKVHWQKRQRELEDKRNQLRRRIFDRQDEIDAQRSRVIDGLEGLMSKQTYVSFVFAIQWTLN